MVSKGKYPQIALIQVSELLLYNLPGYIWKSSQLTNSYFSVLIPTDELHHFSEGWLNHQAVIIGVISGQ